MKRLSIVLILSFLPSLLIYTNPTIEDYGRFIHRKMIDQPSQASDPAAGLMGALLGGFVTNLFIRRTIRKDYVVFSTYETPVGNGQMKAIGILELFLLMEDPGYRHVSNLNLIRQSDDAKG